MQRGVSMEVEGTCGGCVNINDGESDTYMLYMFVRFSGVCLEA